MITSSFRKKKAARDFLMQCFQKDPNLRVSARKLLKHPWIMGSRRSDAPVSKAPSNFNEAVEEVKQWNKALKSSENNLRASIGSDGAPPTQPFSGRANLTAAARGPLTILPKPRPIVADAFRSPEIPDDDNWDNDFATAISPGALQLPRLKPQDNFGGLLSSDRLKAFASIDDSRNMSANWDDVFDGELVTIKNLRSHMTESDTQQTIRPTPKKPDPVERSEKRAEAEAKAQKPGKRRSSKALSSQAKSPTKLSLGSKFELPPRPDLIYREQSVEDYSDLFDGDDQVFDNRLNLVPKVDRRPRLLCFELHVPTQSHSRPRSSGRVYTDSPGRTRRSYSIRRT